MLTLEHDILLQLRVFDLVVLYKHVFSNDLDGIQLLVERELSKEDFAECSLTEDELHLEVSKCWRSAVISWSMYSVDHH